MVEKTANPFRISSGNSRVYTTFAIELKTLGSSRPSCALSRLSRDSSVARTSRADHVIPLIPFQDGWSTLHAVLACPDCKHNTCFAAELKIFAIPRFYDELGLVPSPHRSRGIRLIGSEQNRATISPKTPEIRTKQTNKPGTPLTGRPIAHEGSPPLAFPQRQSVVDVIRNPETVKKICTPRCPFHTSEEIICSGIPFAYGTSAERSRMLTWLSTRERWPARAANPPPPATPATYPSSCAIPTRLRPREPYTKLRFCR